MNKILKKTLLSRFILISFIGLMSFSLHANEKYTAKRFLFIMRRNHPVNTWGILKGTVSQRRRGSSAVNYPIRLGIRFTDTRQLAQIVIDNNEKYTIGQPYTESPPSIIVNHSNYMYKLAELGLRPDDITMTFIYWKFEKELKNQSVSGENCRVFELINPKTKEKVIVYVSSAYFAPLKAEWIKSNETKPYRTLLVKAFDKDNDLWAPSEFTVSGPGWRTRVDFDKIDLGYVKNGIPKDLFMKNTLKKFSMSKD
ncbi:MAG TPA: outer membrane lipoprotein-sorting protein [Victivallales bacterium]|nr:outer membrane lipoprotein-sorting protein [Victivallales bacterium]